MSADWIALEFPGAKEDLVETPLSLTRDECVAPKAMGIITTFEYRMLGANSSDQPCQPTGSCCSGLCINNVCNESETQIQAK